MAYLSLPYQFKFFKDCLPQILLGPFFASFVVILAIFSFQHWIKITSHFYQIMFLKISLSREWNFPVQASSTLPLTLTVIISFCILKPTYFLTSYEDGIGSSEMRSQIFSQFVNCFVVFSKIKFHMKKN